MAPSTTLEHPTLVIDTIRSEPAEGAPPAGPREPSRRRGECGAANVNPPRLPGVPAGGPMEEQSE
jgi:hypothetical protein